jgi:hypothetical protein
MGAATKKRKSHTENRYENDQQQYYLGGKRVSREQFYKQGFKYRIREERTSLNTTRKLKTS